MKIKKETIWHDPKAYYFILPGVLLFLFFFLYPMIYSIKLSTTDASFYNLIKGPSYIGFSNYKDLIISAKIFFPLLRTMFFILTSVPLKIVIALALAILFNSKYVKFKNILYPCILVPWAIPWFLSVMIWRGMFSVDFGVINQIFKSIGLPSINWLNSTWSAFITYNIVEIWLASPFVISVLISAIQSIPLELYETGLIDGASSWSLFRHITIPMIKKSLIWVSIIQIIASYMIFGVPFLLNQGGPGRTNEFLMVYGYKEAFYLGRYGYAAAFMIIVFIILSILVIIYLRITKLTKED